MAESSSKPAVTTGDEMDQARDAVQRRDFEKAVREAKGRSGVVGPTMSHQEITQIVRRARHRPKSS
jgi:hypothetical protein